MKTSKIYIAAALALTLAACSDQADFTQADIANAAVESANAGDVPVNFGLYIGQNYSTRALTNGGELKGITTTSLKTGDHAEAGFGVFSYHHTGDYAGTVIPNFMFNQQVKWSTSGPANVWEYSPVKYWPNGIDASNAANDPSNSASQQTVRNLSFFAYAPYISTVGTTGITALPTNSDATRPVLSYKLTDTRTESTSVDLLWGLRGKTTYEETDGGNNTGIVGTDYNVNLTKQKVDEHVMFLFKHALAKIGALKVVADVDDNSSTPKTTGIGTLDANTLITLNSVTIKDKGGKVYLSGNFDISQGKWTGHSAVTSGASITSITTSTANINAKVWEPASVAYTTDHWSTPDGGVIPTELRNVYADDKFDPILFIPNAEDATDGDKQVLEVEVEYVVRTYDSKLDDSANDDSGTGRPWSKVTQKIKNDVTMPLMTPNTNYTLVMHIGLTSVKFSAEVGDWDGGSTEVVWLPSNVVNTTAWTLDAGSTQTVHTLATATSYTVNITGLADGTYTLDTTGTDVGITSTSPANAGTVTVASGVGTITLSFAANSSTSAVKSQKAVLKLTPSGGGDATTTTITVIQDKAAS